jgi:hypothetical protein
MSMRLRLVLVMMVAILLLLAGQPVTASNAVFDPLLNALRLDGLCFGRFVIVSTDAIDSPEVLAHEMEHRAQCEELGLVRYFTLYIYYDLFCFENPLETVARRAELSASFPGNHLVAS